MTTDVQSGQPSGGDVLADLLAGLVGQAHEIGVAGRAVARTCGAAPRPPDSAWVAAQTGSRFHARMPRDSYRIPSR